MSSYIEWLESLSEKDTRARAVLRRSLAFGPGMFVPAFPYVEPFLRNEEGSWRRAMFYLVAGLWAAHWREGRTGAPIPIGKACAIFDLEKRQKMSRNDRSEMSSMEKRFVALIDSDLDQLPHRLRQILALLQDQAIDFNELLKGLLHWNDHLKRTQNTWARDFYRYMRHEIKIEPVK